MVDQMNRWILVQSGFIGLFDLPWSQRSLILIRIITKERTLRGCLHEKTRTGASFIQGWLFNLVSPLYTGSSHISLFEGPLHVDEIHVWFKLVNITHALPVPVYRQTDVRSKRVVVLCLNDTAARPEWNSRPGTRTGVKSRRGDSRRHDILWWYHVNKFRAIRGNRSELALGRKSPRCHVNTRLVARFIEEMSYVFSFTFFSLPLIFTLPWWLQARWSSRKKNVCFVYPSL